MKTTSKLILAAAIALNLAAIAIAGGMFLQQQAHRQAQTVTLGTIVVTPANADSRTVNLDTVVVVPSDADWRYAQAHGIRRPAKNTVVLGSIVVRPSASQLAEIADIKAASNAQVNGAATADDVASASLIKSLEAFSPGKYLTADATLRVLNALVFERSGS